MGAFNARSLKHLAVKKAHGGPIAKLKLIKNRGQIMPPTSSMKFYLVVSYLYFSFIAERKFLIVSFFSVFAFASTIHSTLM